MIPKRKRGRVALDLHGHKLMRLGWFLVYAGCASEWGSACAKIEWQRMDSVSRAAVIRLGLKPSLVALGCIPTGS